FGPGPGRTLPPAPRRVRDPPSYLKCAATTEPVCHKTYSRRPVLDEERRMQIEGKKAVIVGGASGMARATAERLHSKGASIAILDLPTSKGAEVAEQLSGTFHPCDVTDFDGAE